LKLIFDTSAVIYLMEKWGLVPELLNLSATHELLVPQRVREEFLNGDVSEADRSNIDRVFGLVSVALDEELLPFFNFDSSDGAIWVISFVSHTQGSCCVIDEEFGRSVCDTVGVKFTGSIGILRLMVKERLIEASRVKEVKTRIRQSSFYQKDWLLDKIDV
jgi:predicted nucleic acid-binding protein